MQLKDPRVRLITVVDTEISRDLHYAKVFVSALGNEEEKQAAVAALHNAMGFIRRQVAQRIELRVVPELRFIYDNTIERATSLTAMIDRLKNDGGS